MSSPREPMNREPFDAEERELATRLAQLSAAGGPSPALDARILAAARAEAATPAGRPVHANRRPRAVRRWPVAAGAVATLALAVGLSWQLRPTPDEDAAADQFYSVSEAPATSAGSGPSAAAAEAMPVPDMAPPAAATAAAEQADAAQKAAEPLARVVPAPVSQPPSDGAAEGAASGAARDAQAFPDAARRESRARIRSAPLEEEPQIVFDDPSPVLSAPAPAAAPPPPPPMPMPQQSNAARAASADSAREAKAAGERSELDRVEVTGSRIGRDQAEDEAFDASINDEPPATADSPEVQRAWLQRIRELLVNGDPAAARASLAEFRRRYPQYVLPDDLRGLAP